MGRVDDPRPDQVSVGPYRPDDRDEVLAVLARAFWPDPMFGFFARTALDEHRMLPHFITAVMNDAMSHGEVDSVVINDRVVGTASWLRPGDAPRSWMRETRISLRCARALVRGRNRMKGIRLLDEMAKGHPTEPHWYLALLGTDPAVQGRGVGSALLAPAMQQADAEGVSCYLETQKEENLPFYARFGFEVLHTVSVPGSPTVWCLNRSPR